MFLQRKANCWVAFFGLVLATSQCVAKLPTMKVTTKSYDTKVKPPHREGFSKLLWKLPFLAKVGGVALAVSVVGGIVLVILRHKRHTPAVVAEPEPQTSPELQNILKKHEVDMLAFQQAAEKEINKTQEHLFKEFTTGLQKLKSAQPQPRRQSDAGENTSEFGQNVMKQEPGRREPTTPFSPTSTWPNTSLSRNRPPALNIPTDTPQASPEQSPKNYSPAELSVSVSPAADQQSLADFLQRPPSPTTPPQTQGLPQNKSTMFFSCVEDPDAEAPEVKGQGGLSQPPAMISSFHSVANDVELPDDGSEVEEDEESGDAVVERLD